MLDARLARLGEEAQRLLTLAAVIGQEVPLALWATVAETDEDALLDAVDAATEAQLVTALPDGSAVLFAHALVREALYEGLVATRRRRVHQRIGEALIATRDPNPDAVADHLRRAGDTRAWDWLEQAGQRAQRAYAWVTAAERYEAALVLLEGRADQARQRALLLMTLAQLRRYDQPERGLAALEEAARLVASGDEALVAAIQFDHGHLQCMAGREMQRGLAEMTAALPVLEALPAAERAGLPALVVLGIAPEERYHLGALVLWLSISGRYDDAVRHGAPFARREPGTTARGLSGLAGAYSALGRPDEARRATADARAAFLAAGEHNDVRGTWAGEYEEIVLPYETERRAEQAWLLTEAGRAHARARGTMGDDPATMLDLDITLPTLWLDGHWAEARRRVAARAAPAHPGLPRARIARAQGDAAAAWRPVEAHLPDGPASEPGQTRFHFRFTTLRLAADLALDAGDLPTARAWLAAHDRWLAWSGSVLGRAESQALWATYHRAAGNPAQAREHAEAALAHASEPRQPLALLVAHRALGELATADARYGDAEQHLAAALALAEACAAPYERALTLLAQAELRAVAGESAGAHTALSETRALLEPLEARPALARADALAATLAATPPTTTSASTLPFGLSAREAEVLRLVAQGLSDAQVAEQLFLSLYTVKAHLRSVYNKTGAPSRTAAAHLAREHGLA
ncbi:MAG: LuxR C-terminal-related transcriptional regulator [Chloroflexia bacterium]